MDSRTIARFNAKVDRDGPVPAHCPELGPCWLWEASRDPTGYGNFRYAGTMHRAHRIQYQFAHGRIPTGGKVLHRCDNPPCVRGSHLRLGTQLQNIEDRDRKGRQSRGETVPTSKLNAGQVLDMRRFRLAGRSLQSLADQYGVDASTAGRACRGDSWRHV